ncbi:aspartyl-tRNA synthetase [Alkalithermobacter thermoalcaliphilus JW-YL-7 = DSM 7308]|uniref:Aspartate--tRNA ligase n=1 Tax=Alkalithermobacter thermoalcaliphilus JW-YL-7 = DSM 7308 TaxID=1121328 RepID=A0A150FPC5_CLOPD|nr:Aspartyl-tRNA synthetase [[Clostridium] paradoxum JW-YL-7 = DSM 7308]SHK51716.1 aspartyl-tRNA synthetase [[Clostridium] paradoxum JW-YL-7 = DSM 7308]
METLNGLKRTHYCGNVGIEDIGKEVVLMGWVQKSRNLGGLVFTDLRDIEGICQIVFDKDISKEAFEKAEKLGSEYVIAVKGIVHERQSKNPNMKTGDIEVFASELRILNKSETPPIYIKDDDDVSENLRLKYRYLDLRKPSMQKNLILRHKVANIVRNYLSENRFLEIETPFLTKPTPEGARDYLVPSRVNPGKFYALPQSPQIFKQLFMVSGFDRYFQIVKCFRDEDLRADRQPEFTQIDCEMSFVDMEDVISIMEKMMQRIFKEAINVDINLPIPRISYKEAMEKYGSDKPDLRFGFELINVSDIVKGCGFKVFSDATSNGKSVRCINVKGYEKEFTRKNISSLEEFVKTYGAKGLAWIKINQEGVVSPIAKFLDEDTLKQILDRVDGKEGDLILFVADKDEIVFDSLGHLRVEVAKRLNLLKKDEYKLVWVVDFPLFEYDEEEKRYVAKHHPFTSPKDEDLEKLETNPQDVRAKAYDLVLNGFELGGGSIRIYNSDVQMRMFKALGFNEEQINEKFGFLIEAFKYGTPPHGGIAFGFDRIVMLLAGEENIRQVIAFPKTQNASCPMTNAPSDADEKQLQELNIKTL